MLGQVAGALQQALPAALLVVMHIGRHRSMLPEILTASGPLPARHPANGEGILPGHIYVAPPDHHMVVQGDHIQLLRGPKGHHARPAIDPLFRTAALAHGHGVVGVVLSGMLDDGTAGLQAIKQCGGTAVVQDPADAIEPSMPASALHHVDVDHRSPAQSLAALLNSLARTSDVPAMPQRDPSLEHERALMEGRGHALDHLQRLGTPSTYVCPDCHGALWQLAGSPPLRFRCHTGHAYTARTLADALARAADDAIWSALRAVQEQRLLLDAQADQLAADAGSAAAHPLHADIRRLDEDAATLRQMLQRTVPDPPVG